MTIGVGTCFDYDLAFEPMCKLIAKAGFKAITLGARIEHSLYNTSVGQEQIKRITSALGLAVDSVHAPLSDLDDIADPDEKIETPVQILDETPIRAPELGLGPDVGPAAPQEPLVENPLPEPGSTGMRVNYRPTELRLESIARVKTAVDAAAALGASIVILHPGQKVKAAEEVRSRISAARDSLKELLPYAAERGIRLALENMPSPLSMQVFETLLEQLPGLYVCYDTSHAQLSGDPFGVMKRYRNRIVAVHISDNQGKEDDHVLPFEGVVAWEEFGYYLPRLDRLGVFMLEIETRESAFKDRGEFLAEAFRRATQVLELSRTQP